MAKNRKPCVKLSSEKRCQLVAEYRENPDITQAELAAKYNVCQTTVSLYCRSTRTLRRHTKSALELRREAAELRQRRVEEATRELPEQAQPPRFIERLAPQPKPSRLRRIVDFMMGYGHPLRDEVRA